MNITHPTTSMSTPNAAFSIHSSAFWTASTPPRSPPAIPPIASQKPTIGFTFPRLNELAAPVSSYTYLFSIDNAKFFLAAPIEPEDGFVYREMMDFRGKEPKYLSFAAVTALQLSRWYSANRYCGKCCSELEHDQKERMMRCANCGNTVYPKLSPAVIVGVTDGDRLLLTKYAGRAYKRYALIAGFSEIGESVEDTVVREVMEEVGVKVKNLRFYKSQPWSFTDTLLMGFYCDLDGSDQIVIDKNELAEAEWVHKKDIDVAFDNISLTNEMITHFKVL
jgi:NAD+ diphosphatase